MPGSMVLLEESFNANWPLRLAVQSGTAGETESSDTVDSTDTTNTANTKDSEFQFIDLFLAFLDSEERTVRLLPNEAAENEFVENKFSEDDVAKDKTLFFLDEPMVANRLYMQSVWQTDMNFMLPLTQSLEQTRIRVVTPTADNSSREALFGTLKQVGAGYGVLLDSAHR